MSCCDGVFFFVGESNDEEPLKTFTGLDPPPSCIPPEGVAGESVGVAAAAVGGASGLPAPDVSLLDNFYPEGFENNYTVSIACTH